LGFSPLRYQRNSVWTANRWRKCRMTSFEPLSFGGLRVVGSALFDVFSSLFEARRRHEYEHDIQISECDPSPA
jgi:hypothetical protein